MLSCVVLAAFHKSTSDADKARATLCWMLLYYVNMIWAFNTKDYAMNPVLRWIDLTGQIATNWYIVSIRTGAHGNRGVRALSVSLQFLHGLAALTHVASGLLREDPKWSYRSVALSYMFTLVCTALSCETTNAHFNAALVMSMLTGLLLKLSRHFIPWLWGLGHLTTLVYTVELCKAIGSEILI